MTIMDSINVFSYVKFTNDINLLLQGKKSPIKIFIETYISENAKMIIHNSLSK